MIITFTHDVPNEDTPSAGPLYVAGYCCDVAETFAREMIKKGVAVAGVVAPVAEPPKPAPVEAERFYKKRRF